MSVYYENESVKLIQGDMLSELDNIDRESIDCIITDPPYELGFMGKSWDNTGIVYQPSTWEKCFRVLKPGGYLLAFGGSRTFYRLACAIEDGGFEIRDTIMWLYGSGFPKSLDIAKAVEGKLTIGSANVKDIKKLDGEKYTVTCGFNRTGKEVGYRDKEYEMIKTNVTFKTDEGIQWKGWYSALKPAFEPIIVARKPFDGSLTNNILEYGVGAYNIDECRIGTEYIEGGTAPNFRDVGLKQKEISGIDKLSFGQVENAERIEYEGHFGRYPSNLILSYGEEDKEEVCGGFPYTKSTGGSGEKSIQSGLSGNVYDGGWSHDVGGFHLGGLGDEGSASRFFENCNWTEDDFEDVKRYFYCPKASRQDRDEGIENKNYHPTVKPTKLMRYLVRLVAPKGATVLDPFNGSGSTGKAVMLENREFGKNYIYVGIDLSEDYLEISKQRIEYARTGEVVPYYDKNNNVENESQTTVNKVKSYKKLSLW